MKRILNTGLLLAGALLFSHPSFAQEDDMPGGADRLKELKAQKAAYITSKLGFTAEEAQRLWPVYNEFDEAREQLRKEMRDMHRTAKDGVALTDAEATEILRKHLANREKELAMERAYSDRFVKTIGAAKTLDLFKAERDFNREVLHRFRERQDNGGDKRPGTPQRRR